MYISILINNNGGYKKTKYMTTKITNEKLFYKLIQSVEINNVKNISDLSFYANIQIELVSGEIHEIDGEFGYKDYQNEYGFIFIK